MTPVSHVVVAFDFTHSAHAALRRAVALAARAPGHVLHVLCVVDPKHPIPSIPSYAGVDGTYAARVQEALAIQVQEELDATSVASRIHFFVHARIARDAADQILELAHEVGAELIIVGSHNRSGVERMLVGSVSGKVAREAACSVEIARATRYAEVARPVAEPVEPHRYTYEDRRVSLRPPEWPLS